MAVCTICGGIFDNVDGVCPNCGSTYAPSTAGRSAMALFQEARERIQAGQVIDGKGLLLEAIRMDAENPEFQFLLGSVLYKLQDFDAAYKAWTRADRMKPGTDRILKCLTAARQRITEQEKK